MLGVQDFLGGNETERLSVVGDRLSVRDTFSVQVFSDQLPVTDNPQPNTDNLFSTDNREPITENPQTSPLPSLSDAESSLIRSALLQARGNKTHAAQILGISVRTLRRKLGGR